VHVLGDGHPVCSAADGQGLVSQAAKSCIAPPESVQISTGSHLAGSCAGAGRVTSVCRRCWIRLCRTHDAKDKDGLPTRFGECVNARQTTQMPDEPEYETCRESVACGPGAGHTTAFAESRT
jgi:hypothetical protein